MPPRVIKWLPGSARLRKHLTKGRSRIALFRMCKR